MPHIEITIFPLDSEGTSKMGDFGDYCFNLSRLRGAECRLKENGAIIEGDTDTLLEILNELDNSSFIIGAKKSVVVKLKIGENHDVRFNKPETSG